MKDHRDLHIRVATAYLMIAGMACVILALVLLCSNNVSYGVFGLVSGVLMMAGGYGLWADHTEQAQPNVANRPTRQH